MKQGNGMNQALVCVVTGASRGVGRGVALALGASGATVYVTGRSVKEGDSPLPGTVGRTAADVTAAGGHGMPWPVTMAMMPRWLHCSSACAASMAGSTFWLTVRLRFPIP